MADVDPNNGTPPPTPPPVPISTAPAIDPLITFTLKISDKLDEKNFLVWRQQVEPMINAHNLQSFIHYPEIPDQYLNSADRDARRENPHYRNWLKQDQWLLSWLQSTLSSAIMPRVLGCTHSFQLWERLHDHFQKLTRAKARQLRTELRSTTLESRSVEDYLLRIKSIVDSLASVGDPVPVEQHIDVILEGLPEDYAPVISVIESKFEANQLEEVEALLLAHELRSGKFKKKSQTETLSINLTNTLPATAANTETQQNSTGNSVPFTPNASNDNSYQNSSLSFPSLFLFSPLHSVRILLRLLHDSSDCFEGSLNTSKRRSAPNSSTPNFRSEGYSKEALQRSNSQSSDSLDSLFDDKDPPEISMVNEPKEEIDEVSDVFEDKRNSLLKMNFSVEEVEFAIHKLGDASVPDLVDFIFAAQIARKMEKEAADDITFIGRGNETNEKLFGIMAKTLQLFEMGFSENEVSSAIDKLGTEVPISELANFIFAEQNGIDYVMEYKYPYASAYSVRIKDEDLYGTEEVKPEIFGYEPSQSMQPNLGETSNGERVKEEDYVDGFPGAVSHIKYSESMENDRSKRPKYEYDDDSSSSLDPFWVEEKVDTVVAGMARLYNSNPSRCLTLMQAKPPFFLFGNVSNISYDSWTKMSHFLYAIEPEFVNTQFFSALNRIEGYIHNLPVENRFHILPKPHMTIEDAIPRTKKWWPPWDLRKQLNGIYCETGGIAQLCDRLGKILTDSGGVLTSQQQKDILQYCHGLNLVWIGKYKLGPIEPENLELILGYPLNHTRECDLTERLKLLKYCFQTDTFGYHLSVLKPLFPNGLTMLSLFSGIGGAEIALHRLDIKLKAVVSVETSVTKRKILERWWRSSGQTGTLVQIEGIQKLTNKTFENLISRFGGFDLVIYQNPCSQANPRAHASEDLSASEFSDFCECVRILQRVRIKRTV